MFDHPSTVNKSRRKKDGLVSKTKDFDNWGDYIKDSNFKNSWIGDCDNEDIKKRLKMSNNSFDRIQQSYRNVDQNYYKNNGELLEVVIEENDYN